MPDALVATPRAHDQEVRILAQIARAVIEPAARERLLGAHSLNEVLALVSEHRPPGPLGRSRASLADI